MPELNNEPVVTNMKDVLGKRGFIVEDGKTFTVTVIAYGDDMLDRQSETEVEVIRQDGERLSVEFSEITFDEPETPLAAAPAPLQAQPEAPKAMTLANTQKSDILDPNTYVQMKGLAQDFFSSKAVPSAYENMLQVLMALQAGKEMGLQPIESIQSLTIINGSISLWGKAVPNRLRQHGWNLAFSEGQDDPKDERTQYCEATITKGDEKYTEKINYGEAIDSGYTMDKYNKLKPGWKPGMNRRLKLRYDVLDVLCKTYVPEVFGPTAGTAEVLADVDFTADAPTLKDKIGAARTGLNTKAKAQDVIDQ